MILSSPSYNKPLPASKGPKLGPFSPKNPEVEFISLLSDLDSDGHAHVFEVGVASEEYALKIVGPRSLTVSEPSYLANTGSSSSFTMIPRILTSLMMMTEPEFLLRLYTRIWIPFIANVGHMEDS